MTAPIPCRTRGAWQAASVTERHCTRVISAISIPVADSKLLEAMARRLPWLSLHVVGNWDRRLGLEVGSPLPPNVHAHGFLPYADAERIRMACDVLLAPYQRSVITHAGADTSRWMSPLKIFEYMAAGKAIVCSDIAVLHEVLADKKTAWFCPPDDIDAWCAALTQLRDDERLRTHLGKPRVKLSPVSTPGERGRSPCYSHRLRLD